MSPALSAEQIKLRLRSMRGWRVARGQLKKKYVLGDFVKALRFVNKVGRLAEEQAHHPDITINYNQVTLTLSTHDEGGIGDKDFRLAAAVEEVAPKAGRRTLP